MKTIRTIFLLTLTATLLSFAMGGEHYQISVNGTKAVDYFVYEKKEIPTLSLDKTVADIGVYYNNCGQASKGRRLAVVDDRNQSLKEWEFEDVPSLAQGTMHLDGKEVYALLAKSNARLSLKYLSDDLTKGRVLAVLLVGKETVAKTE